ncbi:hypothetical protein [uncultured Cardiobacterium sp.]|uniref:hypothetical protein n=1 Tax=uncultured Cardiobacterium sp. TaxID=417619 RepID=UPI00260267CE|nr:hypothetical protein [uncultured Cardiobacterium sp.]
MKYGRNIGVFILFLFTILTASAQDEGKKDAVPYKELKKHIPAECKGLHKVKDIDDLILQMYENLDSRCLFIVPDNVLEKTWGIPVLDYDTDAKSEASIKRAKEIEGDIDDGTNDVIYANRFHDCYQGRMMCFIINTTTHYERLLPEARILTGSIDKGEFPKLLPLPQVIRDQPKYDEFKIREQQAKNGIYKRIKGSPAAHGAPYNGLKLYIPSPTSYDVHSLYYWLNHDKSDDKLVLMLETSYLPLVKICLVDSAKILKDKELFFFC